MIKVDNILIYPNFVSRSNHPPLGLVYIGSNLIKHGFSVKIIDCSFFETLEQVKQEIQKYDFKIAGLSFLSSMQAGASKVAQIIKEVNPESLVVAGGPHPTVFKEKSILDKNIDVLAIGEGEVTFGELTRTVKDSSSQEDLYQELARVKGIWFKKQGEVIKNPPRAPIDDLNKLAMPIWDLLPESYFQGRVSIMTSRGCPFNCSYCQPTQRMLFGNKLKFETPERVLNKIRTLIEKFETKFIMFEDDTFTINEERVGVICDAIIREGINKKVVFRCHIRARPFPSRKLLEKMRQANFRQISVGFESGSDKILKELNKGATVADNIKGGVTLRKMGFKVFAYIILGSPSETKETLQETLKMIKKIKPFEVRVSVLAPLPGTWIEEYCRKNNLLNTNISEEEKYHYDSFRELPVKIKIDKKYLLKTKSRIEHYVRYHRLLNKIKDNPLVIFDYLKRLTKLLVRLDS